LLSLSHHDFGTVGSELSPRGLCGISLRDRDATASRVAEASERLKFVQVASPRMFYSLHCPIRRDSERGCARFAPIPAQR
jgi:hypothetical protein